MTKKEFKKITMALAQDAITGGPISKALIRLQTGAPQNPNQPGPYVAFGKLLERFVTPEVARTGPTVQSYPGKRIDTRNFSAEYNGVKVTDVYEDFVSVPPGRMVVDFRPPKQGEEILCPCGGEECTGILKYNEIDPHFLNDPHFILSEVVN